MRSSRPTAATRTFVVRDDFGSVAHVHGSWEGSDFILRDVPFVSGGNHRILASFAVDANVLNICVDEGAVHAHPTGDDTWVHAATESSVLVPGTATTTQNPWDLSKTQNATPTTLIDGELTKAFSTPRLQCPGGQAITLDLGRLPWSWRVPNAHDLLGASAPPHTVLGACCPLLIARFNGALTHTHATIPERVTGDPCAASFVSFRRPDAVAYKTESRDASAPSTLRKRAYIWSRPSSRPVMMLLRRSTPFWSARLVSLRRWSPLARANGGFHQRPVRRLPARAVATTDARADDDARAHVRVAGSPNV